MLKYILDETWKKIVHEVKTTNKELLYSMRREMYRLYIAQLDMPDILEQLSTKYHIQKSALNEDWQKRTQWVYEVFDLEPRRACES